MIFRKLWILHICAEKNISDGQYTVKNKEIETELFSYLKPLYEHELHNASYSELLHKTLLSPVNSYHNQLLLHIYL